MPPALVPILVTFFAIFAVLILAYTVCLFLAGFWIRQYRNRVFVLVVAALTCIGIPYGTVLGVFTFIVMQRPTARDLFTGITHATVPSDPPPPLPELPA